MAYLPRLKKRSLSSSEAVSRFDLTTATLASAGLHRRTRVDGVVPAREIGVVIPLHALGIVISGSRGRWRCRRRCSPGRRDRAPLRAASPAPSRVASVPRYSAQPNSRYRVLGANSLKWVHCPNIGPTPVSWTHQPLHRLVLLGHVIGAGACRSCRRDRAGSRRTRTR